MIKLAEEDVDDLIYACRTNDIEELSALLKQQAERYSVTEAEVIQSAIDEDDEGLGSRACILHYPAANGNLEVLNELLRRLGLPSAGSVVQNNDQVDSQTTATRTSEPSITAFVNHQNISGNSPLHWAALNGHLEVVKALVGAGADPTIVNEAGRDAVVEAEYSSKGEASECATWLLKECESLETGMNGVHTLEDGTLSPQTDNTQAQDNFIHEHRAP